MAGKGKNLGSNAKRRSRRSKAGLKFPVACIARFLKVGKYAKRVGAGAPVFLAVVLEYLAVEVLELAGIAARNDKKTRITPRHIQLAIRFDKELYQFLRDVTIPNGGVIPKIHKILLPDNKSNTSKAVVVAQEDED
ncbi:probable histone H2A.3 [Solanum pennellii]|uniref:Histone H2A n=1 Tax=Solanum pennellii TaxID=28526 RepID=A0ABM1GTR3_SOLPN|nr:probable histone H2A.3 [Solanum pennellii]